MTGSGSKPRVRNLIPSLGVSDLARSVAFYRDFFGFEIADSYESENGELQWCLLRSGVAELMLQQLDNEEQITLHPAIGQSWVLYIRPHDIEDTCQRIQISGLAVSEIRFTTYGSRECFMTDPDGYELWLSEPDHSVGAWDDEEGPDEVGADSSADGPSAIH